MTFVGGAFFFVRRRWADDDDDGGGDDYEVDETGRRRTIKHEAGI